MSGPGQPSGVKKNYDRSGRFDVTAWREAQVHKRTKQYFRDRDRRFAEEHPDLTDEQLLNMIRLAMRGMHHVPQPTEIEGGFYIAERFGSWDEAMRRLGITYHFNESNMAHTKVYREEYERQDILFTEERRRIKAEKATRKKEKKHKAAAPETDESLSFADTVAEAAEEDKTDTVGV